MKNKCTITFLDDEETQDGRPKIKVYVSLDPEPGLEEELSPAQEAALGLLYLLEQNADSVSYETAEDDDDDNPNKVLN